MKQISTILLVVLMVANAVFAQRKITNTPPPEPKLEVLEGKNPFDKFAKKGLPDAYIVGKNRSDELAVSLAKDILKYDQESLPMVMGALQKVGFYIIDQNQKVLYTPTSTYDMEMSFYDFEVVGMLKTSAIGTTTTIKKLAEVISQNNSGISADKLGNSILDDLRKAKNSTDGRLRFAANLIFELGKQSKTPIDLATATPETAKINIIQLSIIERILLGDLMDSYAKLVAVNYRENNLFKSNEVRFVNTAFLKFGSSLCDAWDDLSTLQNTSKNVYKRFKMEKLSLFAKTLDECELLPNQKAIDDCKAAKAKNPNNNSRQQFLESIAKGLRLVIISLASNKLQSAYQNIKIDLKVQQPMPLVRTKSSINIGETRDVTAKFTMEWSDPQKATQVVCLEKLAAGSNPKFDLLESPSLEGKTVTWALNSADGADFGDDSVKLSSHADKLTGQSGESIVSVVGKPQSEDLTNRKVYATPKTAYLAVYIGENNAYLAAEEVRIPIRDWIPCTDDWSGTINYESEYFDTLVIKSTRLSNGNGTGDGIKTVKKIERASIKLNPRKPEEMKTKPPNPAHMDIFYFYGELFEGVTEDDPCCGKTEGSFTTKFKKGFATSYIGDRKGQVSIKYRPSERDFSLGFSFSTGDFKIDFQDLSEVTETNCSMYDDPIASNTPKKADDDDLASLARFRSFADRLEDGRYGDRAVGTAGEVLFGTKVFNLANKTKITWKWDLYRCRD